MDGRVIQTRTGTAPGLSASVIQTIQRQDYWPTTRQTLLADVNRAADELGVGGGILHADDYQLTVESGDLALTAAYSAPRYFSESFPDVESLATFVELVDRIEEATR